MTRLSTPRRFAALLLLAATAAVSATAQDWAKAALAKSPRHGEFVTITEASGRKLQAWVVYPEIKDKAPVVVMIHEIFGQSDWARDMADEVASAGYIVVEPDLLSELGPPPAAAAAPMPAMAGMGCDPMPCAPGQKPLLKPEDHAHMPATGVAFVPLLPGGTAAFPPDTVTRAVSSLPPAQVTADLDAAADYGKKLAAANGKLYVAGFCWGGQNTFLYATHRKDLSASFVFYGPPPAADLMKQINAPVYGFYAGNDARVTSSLPQAEVDMKAAGKVFEPVVYEGAGHGFMRAGEAPDASAPNSAARNEGYRRLIKLLGGVH